VNKLFAYVGAVIAFISGLLGLFFFGKKEGCKAERQKNTEENLKVANEFKKDSDNVSNKSNDDIHNELREDARN
jgi:hypothetical protein